MTRRSKNFYFINTKEILNCSGTMKILHFAVLCKVKISRRQRWAVAATKAPEAVLALHCPGQCC